MKDFALRFGNALVGIQTRRPLVFLALGAVVTAMAVVVARGLELRTQFDQLLPESQASVQEYRRVAARIPSQSKVFVVLEGRDTSRLRLLGDELVRRLSALGPPAVVSVEDGVHEARRFLMPRAALFAKVEDLVEARDDLANRWGAAVARATGIDFEEDEAPPIDGDRLKRLAGPNAALIDRFPDGYYQTSAGDALIVAIETGIRPGDLGAGPAAVRTISNEVTRAADMPQFAGVRASLTGDLVTGLSEYGAIRTDLISVGAIGISLVLGVILLYFVRLRSLVALGTAILAGTAWTFALTRLAIGHLNVATGFLFSIVAGNGINCGIIYFGRYLEERRHGSNVAAAVRTAHRETWVPTLTAALAATASYGSLATSDFRGLKHFALIGGAGILLCWIATYTLLGPIVVLIDGANRYARGGTFWSHLRYEGVRYDAPFSLVLRAAPRTILLVGLGLSFLGSALAVSYFRGDPIEYDMKRLFNQMGGGTDLKRLSTLAREIVGVDAESSMSIVADDVGQVPRLAKALEAKRDAAPAGQEPFEAVHTLFDFVPDRQNDKIPLLLEMRGLLLRARGRGAIADADWSRIEPFLPPATLAPFGIDDLPKAIARPFTERDGTRGRLVHIEPTHGEDEDDAHYLIRWADSFRETKLSETETIRGSGRVVLFADMLRAVLTDVPRTTVLALALTVAMVIAAAGFTWEAFAVLGSLLVGVSWLFVLMVLFRIKLHFLNFVALPITFGIGVDYAINIARRYRDEPSLSPLDVLRRTGGAVVLCSLTTMLGYLALVGSKNQAVHSLGVLAVLGEICCLLSAMLVLPAALLLFGEKRSFRTGHEPAP